jgi:isocitrate/isopropylmalate dehydrogenase
MLLVRNPYELDVLVMENMFGDILSDLMAGLVGGLGLAPAANIGKKAAIFEAVHGSAPDIAGKGVANPSALILASAMLLEHVGSGETAKRVRTALERTLATPTYRTRDLGGSASTDEFTAALVRNLG